MDDSGQAIQCFQQTGSTILRDNPGSGSNSITAMYDNVRYGQRQDNRTGSDGPKPAASSQWSGTSRTFRQVRDAENDNGIRLRCSLGTSAQHRSPSRTTEIDSSNSGGPSLETLPHWKGQSHCPLSALTTRGSNQLADIRLCCDADVVRHTELGTGTSRTQAVTSLNATMPSELQKCCEADNNSGLRGSLQEDPLRPIRVGRTHVRGVVSDTAKLHQLDSQPCQPQLVRDSWGYNEFALYCLYRQTIPDVQP